MPMADVLALVQTISNGAADTTATAAFYSDTITELATQDWFTTAQLWTNTIGQLEVNFQTISTLNLVDLETVVYNSTELDLATLIEMQMIDPQWRDRVGRPTTFIIEDENSKVAALYPAPDEARSDNVVFFSFTPVDAFYYLELYVALRILEREMMRQSNHADMEMATFCGVIAKFFLQTVM